MTVEELIAELHKVPAENRQWPVMILVWGENENVGQIGDVEIDQDNATIFIHENGR